MKINLDSPVIVFLTTVADFMILNILFILCCAPVITIGPAVSALYTITMREARHEGGYIFKPFFKAFKNNFKQAFLLSILYLIIRAVFVFGVKFWLEKPGIFNGQSGDSRDYGSICSYLYFFTFLCICFNSQIR